MTYFLQVGVLLMLLVFYVHKASGIECYSCSSQNNPDCIHPEQSNLNLVKCNMGVMEQTQKYAKDIHKEYDKIFIVDGLDTSRGSDLNCLKHVVKEGNKEHIIRGCQLAVQNELDICHKVRKMDTPILKTVHCSRCSTYACNSAVRRYATPILTTTLLITIAIIINLTQ